MKIPYHTNDIHRLSHLREWRERQQEEIAKRDEESKTRRQETISKAERALDSFYEEYTAKRKAQIAQNKYV